MKRIHQSSIQFPRARGRKDYITWYISMIMYNYPFNINIAYIIHTSHEYTIYAQYNMYDRYVCLGKKTGTIYNVLRTLSNVWQMIRAIYNFIELIANGASFFKLTVHVFLCVHIKGVLVCVCVRMPLTGIPYLLHVMFIGERCWITAIEPSGFRCGLRCFP